jgi:hypothetical protein
MLASLRYLDTFVKIDGSWLVCGALSLRRLAGGTRTVVIATNWAALMTSLQHLEVVDERSEWLDRRSL